VAGRTASDERLGVGITRTVGVNYAAAASRAGQSSDLRRVGRSWSAGISIRKRKRRRSWSSRRRWWD